MYKTQKKDKDVPNNLDMIWNEFSFGFNVQGTYSVFIMLFNVLQKINRQKNFIIFLKK